MDPRTLVSRERIESAGALLRQLSADGLITRGALWAQVEGDGQPYLYVITPNVETEGPIEANLRLGRVLRAFHRTESDPFRSIDPFEIKLIGRSNPLAKGVLDWYERHADDQPTFHHGPSLGGVPIEGAYSYPAKMFAVPAA